MRVSRYLEMDIGHRVARHGGKCANMHGHRMRFTVVVDGPVQDDTDSPEHGMVVDYSRIKRALALLEDEWDHHFLIGSDDPWTCDLEHIDGVVVLDRQPTAENLAVLAGQFVQRDLWRDSDLAVVEVIVNETPASSAVATAADMFPVRM